MKEPKLVGWAACAHAIRGIWKRLDALEGRPLSDGRWSPIDETTPRYHEAGANVPVEFVLILYDPDNEVTYRTQTGFWNERLKDWQSCDEHAQLIAPTHYMPLPLPPGAA